MASTGGGRDGDAATRTVRALERGAAALTTSVARSLYGQWRALRKPAEPAAQPPPPVAESAVVPPRPADSDVTEIEVRDLRAGLARELERLADANVDARRGSDTAGRQA